MGCGARTAMSKAVTSGGALVGPVAPCGVGPGVTFSGGGGGAGAVCVTPEGGAAVCAPARGVSRVAKRARAGMKPAFEFNPAGVAFRAQRLRECGGGVTGAVYLSILVLKRRRRALFGEHPHG